MTRDPDEAELARELLVNNGISTRMEAMPGDKVVEGLGATDRICLEVHAEDQGSADLILTDGMQ
ncbi:hypothetical protein ACFL4R_00895 [Nitrospirota bacterium]